MGQRSTPPMWPREEDTPTVVGKRSIEQRGRERIAQMSDLLLEARELTYAEFTFCAAWWLLRMRPSSHVRPAASREALPCEQPLEAQLSGAIAHYGVET
jgi:hypothetical protein